jgi:TraG-like protein, N-terminal region
MAMIINEAYESYTMLLGFFLNNRIWDLMLITGAFAVPILIMVVNAVAEAYRGGDDEGDRGSMALRYIELGTLKIAFVMIFFMMPLGEPLSVTSMSYNNHTCEAYTDTDLIIGNAIDKDFDSMENTPILNQLNMSVNGVQPRPPIILGLVQNYSTKFTNAVISTIPCTTDIVSMGMTIEETKIKQKDTQDLLVNFIKQCYAPAFREATIERQMEAEDVYNNYWIGAPYFVGGTSLGSAAPGVYKFPTSNATIPVEYYISRVQRAYNASTPSLVDGAYSAQGEYKALDSVQSNGDVTVQCDHYYDILEAHVATDYKEEIQDLEDPFFIKSFEAASMFWNKYFSNDESQPSTGISVIMKRLVEAVNNFDATNFEKTKMAPDGAWDFTKNTLKFVGEAYQGTVKLIDSWFIRSLANPILAMIQCVVFIIAPIVFLLSNYNMKIIGGYLVTIFGLEFVVLIFEVCDWLADNMILLSASSYSLWDVSHGSTQSAIFAATGYSYVILPLVWAAILGKVGMMVGHNVMGAMNSAGQEASSKGQEAGKAAASAGKGAAKKAIAKGAES